MQALIPLHAPFKAIPHRLPNVSSILNIPPGDPAALPLGEDGNPIEIPEGEAMDLTELEAIARSNGGKVEPGTPGESPKGLGIPPGSATAAARAPETPTATSDDDVVVLSPVLVASQNRINSGGKKQGSKKTAGRGGRPTSGKSQK